MLKAGMAWYFKEYDIGLVILLLLCLLNMPYVFYQFMQFVALIGFIWPPNLIKQKNKLK
jgi:hypothetical protein